jgi:hypothetical protein
LTEIAGSRDEVFYSESSIYVEAPVGDRLSIVASPWITQGDDGYGLDALRWEVTLGAKAAVLRAPGRVMALQAAMVWNSDPISQCGEAGAELRWLGGATFGSRDQAFLNLEAAARAFDGGCGGGRYDLTLGYQPRDNWLGMAQVFMDEPRSGDPALKAQLTLVRFGDEGRGVQFGLRARIDGEAPEPALVIGFWGRPGD